MSGNKRSTPEAGAGSAVSDTEESTLDDAGTRHPGTGGAGGNGAVTDGAVRDGAVTDGAVRNGAVTDGAVRDGAASAADGGASRRPSPSASAASRARRIGGRPAPTRAPRPGDDLAVGAAASAGSTARGTAAPPNPSPVATKPATRTPRDASPADAARLRRRLNRLRWTPAAVLGLAAVVLLVSLVVFSHGVYWAKQTSSSAARDKVQEKVLASAKTCFASLNSYNYRTLDASLATGLKCTTGKFTSDYRTAFKNEIAANAPTAQATQSAQVNTAGVASVSPDGKQWVVLIYGQLQVSNVSTAKKSPRIDPFGAVVTLDEVGNQWLISKVGTDVGGGLGN